jgi:FkbM family methyltransferase
VYSVGLGHDISFDLALAKTTPCEIFGFDPTPKTRAWLATQSLPECFHYIPIGLANQDGLVNFAMPSDPTFDDFSIVRSNKGPFVSCEVRRLASLAKQLGHDRIDLLKMDIEGAEYQVIDDICQGTLLPSQLLVEFHHRIDGAHIRDTLSAIAKLRKVGYLLFDVSSSGRELSFISVNRLS